MKIIDVLNEGKLTVSMEVFPPKTDAAFESVQKAVRGIIELSPSYISCTYGAGGGTSAHTLEISREIRDAGIPALAHLTCISSTKNTISGQIRALKDAGIENILALRGDIPSDMQFPGDENFLHATDLIREIRRVYPDACIGGACYPEKHPDARSKDEDIKALKQKVEAGCEFLTTQMFFDNSVFYNFLYRLREAGVSVPVTAGIMPVTSRVMMKRSVELSGCIIPPRFKAMVDMFGEDPASMAQAGIIYASEQIIDLIANGIRHIHVYTMNKPQVAGAILDNLGCIFQR